MSAVDANSDDKKDETHVMRPALSVLTTNMSNRFHFIMLCSKNKDKKSESNSQRLQFNMSGCIPYRRKPPPVRNMRAVLKKASYGTRRVFRSSPCSKQASGVQKGYSVPETPFYGTEQAMCTGKGLLMYRLKRRNAAPALRSVILRKTAICMLLLLPLNSRSQLWTTSNYR